jgi:hypothetical protein
VKLLVVTAVLPCPMYRIAGPELYIDKDGRVVLAATICVSELAEKLLRVAVIEERRPKSSSFAIALKRKFSLLIGLYGMGVRVWTELNWRA